MSEIPPQKGPSSVGRIEAQAKATREDMERERKIAIERKIDELEDQILGLERRKDRGVGFVSDREYWIESGDSEIVLKSGSGESRVVGIYRIGSMIEFTEKCDECFGVLLTKSQAIEALKQAIEWIEPQPKATSGRYGITAQELEDRIIEDLKQYVIHHHGSVPYFLENHKERPLWQTIRMCISLFLPSDGDAVIEPGS